MKVLSLRPLWASAVIFGGKDVENRSWSTDYRGPIAIHASGNVGSAREQTATLAEIMRAMKVKTKNPRVDLAIDAWPKVQPGSIIGVVDLVKVSDRWPRASPWADDCSEYFWHFANPRPCVPFPCRGKLRLWECPDSWAKLL